MASSAAFAETSEDIHLEQQKSFTEEASEPLTTIKVPPVSLDLGSEPLKGFRQLSKLEPNKKKLNLASVTSDTKIVVADNNKSEFSPTIPNHLSNTVLAQAVDFRKKSEAKFTRDVAPTAIAQSLDSAPIGIPTSVDEVVQETENNSASDLMSQVTSVSQLSDVQPTDWAFQALQSLVERYGCIAGYPDGTFRGNRALTRYEFAAGLNACLNLRLA